VNAAAGALLVLAALAAAAALVRRRRAAGPVEPVAIPFRAPMGKECGVALVRWAGRELLVGYGPAGVVLVAERREVEP
jgi:hypothetical protein